MTGSSFSEGKLGLRMSSHEGGSHLIVDGINNDGSIAEWNKSCPELALRKGDMIVGVS